MDREIPTELSQEEQSIEFDVYATRKSHSQNLINVSLIVILINTIILTARETLSPEKIALISIAGFSILTQLVIGGILILLAAHDEDNIFGSSAKILNLIVTLLTGILPILSSTILILQVS